MTTENDNEAATDSKYHRKRYFWFKASLFVAPTVIIVFSFLWPFPLGNTIYYLFLLASSLFSATIFIREGNFYQSFDFDGIEEFGATKALHASRARGTLKNILAIGLNFFDILAKTLTNVFIAPILCFFLPVPAALNPYLAINYIPVIVVDGLSIMASGMILLSGLPKHFGHLEVLVAGSLYAMPYIVFFKMFVFHRFYSVNRQVSIWHPATASIFAIFLFLVGICLANLAMKYPNVGHISLTEDGLILLSQLYGAPSLLQFLFGEFFTSAYGLKWKEIFSPEMHITSLAILAFTFIASKIFADLSNTKTDAHISEAAFTLLSAGNTTSAKILIDKISDDYVRGHLLKAAYNAEVGDMSSALKQLKQFSSRVSFRTYEHHSDAHHLVATFLLLTLLMKPQKIPSITSAPLSELFREPLYPVFLFNSFASTTEPRDFELPAMFKPTEETIRKAIQNWGYKENSSELKRFAYWRDNPDTDADFIRDYQEGNVSELVFAHAIGWVIYSIRYQLAQATRSLASNGDPRFGQDLKTLLNELLAAFFSKNINSMSVSDILVRDFAILSLQQNTLPIVQYHISANQNYILRQAAALYALDSGEDRT